MIRFPEPTTAGEARANMLHWAAIAEHQAVAGAIVGPGTAAIEKAKMWAAIALTLPETDTITLLGDDRPLASANLYEVPQRPGTVAEVIGADGTTVTVESAIWNVLRALAVGYVRTSLARKVTMDTEDVADNGDVVLRLHWQEDSDSVVVTAEDNPVVR